ncbi:MAG TPA: hypothetical protein VLT16_16325, partial [Candidatus Limnocylindrales bacterium]|nr:hypothetical protein [Candidatus Limnocylindrales bacterium]
MSHELFRYLIPGIFFYLPIYITAALIGVLKPHTQFEILLVFAGKEAITLISVLVLPTGWLVYHAWRAYWQLFRGGYEKREFLNRIRQSVRTYEQPNQARTAVDFSSLLGRKVGVRWFTASEFSTVFDPFKTIPSVGFNAITKRKIRENGRRFYLHFVEPVSDLILFEDASYDYARSISSARYGLWVSVFSLIPGSIVGPSVVLWERFPSGRWFAVSFIFIVLAALVTLAFYRMMMARTEHEARVQLITQIHSADRFIRESEANSSIDPEVLARLESVNKLYRSAEGHPKLAAFDMDGTLIRHDMGDAVLAMLIKKEGEPGGRNRIRLGFWKEYQTRLANSRPAGYEYAVTAMNTLAIDEVYQAAREVLSHKNPEIVLSDGTRVPIPELVPKMQAVVMWLHRNGFAV